MDPSASRPAWSSQLAENLIHHKPSASMAANHHGQSHQTGQPVPETHPPKAVSVRSGTPPLVAPLPSNAIVIHTPNSENDTYPQYLAHQFPGSDKVLAQHMDHDEPVHASPQTKDEKCLAPEHEDERPASWTSSILRTLKNDKLQDTRDEEEDEKPWWTARDDPDGFCSIGAFLFLFGFLFPPLWWLGAWWPRRIEEGGKLAERWQKLNKIMSIFFSVLLIAALITVGAIYGSQKNS